VAKFLDREQLALYDLIWKRTMASQMASAELDQVAVDLTGRDKKTQLRATGSVVTFDGFLKVYREDHDEDSSAPAEDTDRLLPMMNEGEAMALGQVRPVQHFTQPPPRFSEASLVKRMEELGIGRPSTYASILSVLQERNYVRLDQRRFIPEDRGRLVTTFLEQFFKRYVEYNFTADLENQLDEISDGKIDWHKVLEDFWRDFHTAVDGTKELRIGDVIEALDAELSPFLFPAAAEGHDPRLCKVCNSGRLSLKLGKFGAFIGCSNYPECRFTRPLGNANGEAPEDAGEQTRELGLDPASQLPISLRKGPYGWYVQCDAPPQPDEPVVEAPVVEGKAKPKKAKAPAKPKPKRVSLYKGLEPKDVSLDMAIALLALPRDVGTHPESGKMIQAGVGRFGPYLLHDGRYKNLGPDDDVLTVGINRAVDLLADAKGKGGGRTPLRTLGEKDGQPITVNSGRFGPYVALGKVYATIPKGQTPEEITLDEALLLIAAKAAKSPTKPEKAPRAKAEPKPKAAAKKPAAKKPATKTARKPSKDAAE
jgi:DNA topoisomerase-1